MVFLPGDPALRAFIGWSALGSARDSTLPTPSPAAVVRSGFVCDDIPEHAEAFDLDLDDVAGLHPKWRLAPRTDATRRSADDDVAGLEPRKGGAIFDLVRDNR
jgi:hypothetical protein